MVFENPANGHVEESVYCWVWTLLFGPLYFAVKGIWGHVLISFVAALLTFGISILIYPFFAEEVVRGHYLKRGWVERKDLRRAGATQGSAAKPRPATMIRCSKCQEYVQFNAKVCRHCRAQFPYLAEPARSHVETISSWHIGGKSAEQIAAALNARGIRPATHRDAWAPDDVAGILRDHVTS